MSINNDKIIKEKEDDILDNLEFCGIIIFLIFSPLIMFIAACIIGLITPFIMIYIIFEPIIPNCCRKWSLRDDITHYYKFIKYKFRGETIINKTELSSIKTIS